MFELVFTQRLLEDNDKSKSHYINDRVSKVILQLLWFWFWFYYGWSLGDQLNNPISKVIRHSIEISSNRADFKRVSQKQNQTDNLPIRLLSRSQTVVKPKPGLK